MKTKQPKLTVYAKSNSKMEVHKDKCPHPKKGQALNNLITSKNQKKKKRKETKPKVNRMEITKTRAEINRQMMIFKKMKIKDSFLKRQINLQPDFPRREDSKLEMKKEILKQIPHKYYEQLYTNKLKNLEEMDKFLETCNLPGLNHEATENLNGLILSKEIESIIKYLPKSCKTRWLHQ